jgi:hypothetical protein
MAALAATFCTVGHGQTFYGSIVGNVTDASGARVANAAVAVTNIGTTERRTVTTENTGIYRFVDLVPGNYRVDVELTGFKHYTRDQIEVQVDATVRIDVAMQVGDVRQSVEVSAASPLLQTESAAVGQVVEGRAVRRSLLTAATFSISPRSCPAWSPRVAR